MVKSGRELGILLIPVVIGVLLLTEADKPLQNEGRLDLFGRWVSVPYAFGKT